MSTTTVLGPTQGGVPRRGRATDILGLVGVAAALVVFVCSLSLARFLPGGINHVPGVGLVHNRLGRQIAVATLIAALGCLGASWWFLRAASGRRRWIYLAVWLVPLTLALPTISSDLYNYAEQGWSLLHGGNPTVVPAGSIPGPFQNWAGYWWGTTVRYPQLGLALSAVSVVLGGGHQYPTLVLLRLWPLIGLVLLAVAVFALSPDTGEAPGNRAWLAVANPVILVHGIVDGHSDLFAIALVLLGIAGFQGRLGQVRGRWFRWGFAVALWVLAGLIKPTALILLAALPWLRGRPPVGWRARILRLTLAGAVVGAAAALTTAVTFVLPGSVRWLSGTGDPGSFTDSLPRVIQTAVGEASKRVAGVSGDTPPFGSVIVPLSVVLALIFIAVVTLRSRTLDGWSVVLIVLTGLALLGPASRPWYFLGIAPSLALLPTATTRRQALFWLQFLLWSLVRLPTMFVNGVVVSLVPWLAIGLVVVFAYLDGLSRRAGLTPSSSAQVA